MNDLFARFVDYHGKLNAAILWCGRQAAWVFIGSMVLIMLIQVFYRYALNAALPWPEEAARVLERHPADALPAGTFLDGGGGLGSARRGRSRT